MKKNGLISFLIGIVFCLLMALPSVVQASVTISGSYGSVNLDSWNASSSDPTVKTATITSTGSADSNWIAVWAPTPGWSVENDGEIYSNYRGGITFGNISPIDGHQIFWDGTVTNNGLIYGLTYGVHLNSGTVTNNFLIESGPGIYGVGGMGVYFWGSEGVLSDATLNNSNTGTIGGFYAGVGFSSLSGGGNVTVTNAGTINAWGGIGMDWNYGGYGGDGSTITYGYGGYGGSGSSGGWDYENEGSWVYTYTWGGNGGSGGSADGVSLNGAYEADGGYGGAGGYAWGGYGAGVYISNVTTATVTNSYMINGWGGEAYGGYGGYGGEATNNNSGSSGGYNANGGQGGAGGYAWGGYGAGIYIGQPINYYDDDDDNVNNIIGISSATVTNSASGIISGWGGGAYGGYGGYGGTASTDNSGGGWGGEAYGGYGGNGGYASGGNGYGIYIDGSYLANAGDDDDDMYLAPGTGTATVTNSGKIYGYGGEAYGGYGGYGGYASTTNSSGWGGYAYGGYGGNGGEADGGYGYGIYIANVGTATVTNNAGGIISGYGGDAYGGYGGYGGSASTDNSGGGWGGVAYGGNGGYGGNAYGGNGYGIFMGNMMEMGPSYLIDDDDDVVSSMVAAVTNYGTISGYGGNAYGGWGGYGGSATTTNSGGGWAGNAYGGYGGNGGNAYGGYGYGVFIGSWMPVGAITSPGSYDVTSGMTAEVDNYGTITGYGGYAWGGFGGSGGSASTSSSGMGGNTAYGGNGGNGGNAYGGYGYGVFIGNVATATVTNYAGGIISGDGGDGFGAPPGSGGSGDTSSGTNGFGGAGYGGDGYGLFIGGAGTATITNSGMISGYGGDGYGGFRARGGDGYGIYAAGIGTLTITNNAGGIISGYGGDGEFGRDGKGYGIYIEDVTTEADVDNAGTIKGDYGIYIKDAATASVTNESTGLIKGQYGIYIKDVTTEADVDNAGTIRGEYGIYIKDAATASVTNESTGSIKGQYGIYIKDAATEADVDNYGTIKGEYGVYIKNAATTNVTNESTGTISGSGYGLNILGQGDVTVTNNEGGAIQSSSGTAINIDGTHWARISDDDDDWGPVTGTGTVTVTNSGAIKDDAYAGDGIDISNVGAATVTNNATGTITGYNGVYMSNIGSADTAEVDNYGTITGYGGYGGYGGYFSGVANGQITNYAGGLITGNIGVFSDGNTTIDNSGTITGTGGTAISLTNGDNQVILRTDSVTNGLIVADGNYSNNITWDGSGTMPANQIQGFSSMDKTGAGTWTLTGDQDYTAYASTAALTIQEGVLALDQRSGVGGGITVASFEQKAGASLGYAVTPDRVTTGELNVTGNANFNNGTVVVIPTPTDANKYALTTTYDDVLTAGSITNKWTNVTATAFLLPSLVADADYTGTGVAYDLVLKRLSFTVDAEDSSLPLAHLLDDLYGSTTDPELLGILNDLLLLTSEGEARKILAELSGGTHTAFQFMSFNSLDRYLGVLNNHMGSGGAFASGNQSTGMALYGEGMQLAMAGGGNSLNDAGPILLAMAGNMVGQGQLAAGTNWGLWADAYYGTGSRRSDELIAKYKQNLFGGMMGFDYRIANNLFLGVSAGISRSDLTFDDLQDNGDMESYQGSLYLCYNGKPWYATGVLTYAYNKYDLERYITLGPTAVAQSDYSGNEYVGYAEVGYKVDAGAVEIRPLAAFQADYLMQDGFVETGAGIYDLSVDKQNTGSYQSFLGVNVSGEIHLGSSVSLKPEFRLKWAHEFSNDDHMINARFAGSGSGSFTVAPEQLNRDTAIVGAGLNLLFNKNVAAYIQYDAELNSDFVNHTGLVGLRFAW